MLIPRTLSPVNILDTSLKFFALILLAILFWKAYQLYKLYSDRSLLYFTFAFLFFTLGNFFSFIIDIFIYTGIITGGILFQLFSLREVIIFFLTLRMGALIMGFISLFFIAIGYPKRNVQAAIILLTLLAGMVASPKSLFFHLTVTLFTLFILYDLYLKQKHGRKKVHSLYFIGMVCMYLAYSSYALFMLDTFFYWIGHGFEIAAYMLFIAALFSIISKNETKTTKNRDHT